MELHEDLPEVGDSVVCEGLEITVAEMDSHRIVAAEVVRLPEEEEGEEDRDAEEEK
jgi:CBS domain containing-hemolysin-like protein